MPKMPRSELSPDEEVAGKIVAHRVGGMPIARDVLGAEDGTHDLDIELPDGRRIPLEVTSSGRRGDRIPPPGGTSPDSSVVAWGVVAREG